MQYRRANIAGATYVITANLAERGTSGVIALTENIGILRHPLRHGKTSHPPTVNSPLHVAMRCHTR